ncbi:MAG TPA: lipid IV(A) 3-deoxy-D-manno-octulosonic acid transferase [Burkholderiales bacterium]|nr:lipid IV(A) 3-deoxy-D-manno-octulosonic acid transferase [Burkholderiales bacterium]
MRRLAYSLALYLLLPWALFHLAWRARRQPEYLRHVGERFGCFAGSSPSQVIWIHAVSVGETRAAEPLVRALAGRHPDARILLTHGTPTGRQTGVDLFGDRVERCYLPYDFDWAVRRFLRHYRPRIGLFMETEIWPNLIRAGGEAGVPMYLVNARMSEKSARGYRRLAGLTRAALQGLAGVGAQTGADARRLSALGARAVDVTGNVKFDRTAPEQMLALGASLRALFGERRPVFLAASTREGEEGLVLDALGVAGQPPDLLMVIVPRHPQRFDEVETLVRRRGLACQRRSANAAIDAGTRVVIGDSMGEMFAYYAACDVAFVGGSLLPLGGQNLLEACAVGRPVVVGPHTFNFEEATRGAVEAGAALRIADAPALGAAVAQLFADGERRHAMGEAGRRFMAAHRGATARTMELLKPEI